MGNDRYLPNSYLESVENKKAILELVETQLYSLSEKLNHSAKRQTYNTVYCGVAGILYMNLLLYEYDKTVEHLNKGKEIVEILNRSTFRHSISFLEGSSGFHSLSSMLYLYLNKENNVTENEKNLYIGEVDVLMKYFFKRKEKFLDIDNGENELLYGKSGLIYSYLFCQPIWIQLKNYKKNILAILYLLMNSIFNNGKKYAELHQERVPLSLYYEWHGSIYLGAAHGYAGILFILLKTILVFFEHLEDLEDGLNINGVKTNEKIGVETLKEELLKHIQFIYKVTAEILDLYVTSEFNVYSSVKREKIEHKKVEKLVQWCHGNPGYIILLIELLKKENINKLKDRIGETLFIDLLNVQNIFQKRYDSLIEKMGELVWEKGLLVKGCGLCHGIAGNGILFLYIYNFTKNEIWYTRALQYGYFCIKKFKQLYNIPDRPDSLFEGYAGLVVFLMFLLKPELTHFPAHDFSKLVIDENCPK